MFVSAMAKFYSGQSETMTPEENVVMAQYARMLLSSSENPHYQYISGFIPEDRMRSGRGQLKPLLSGEVVPFPVRRIFLETKSSYLPDFQEYMDELLSEIDAERFPDQ